MADYTCPVMTRFHTLALSLGASFALAAPSLAQSPAPPAFPHEDRLDNAPEVEFGDEEMARVASALLGQWRASPEEAGVGWTLRVVRLKGQLLTQPLYFELARDGDEAEPARQWIMSFYRSDGALRARVYEFPMGSGLRGYAVGMWAAPDLLPVVTPASLEVAGDMHVEVGQEGIALTPILPFLLNHHTHWAMEPTLRVRESAIAWSEKLFDRNGKQLPASSVNVTLARAGKPPQAQRREQGVRIIDLREGRGGVAEISDVPVFWYTGWLTDGTVFETNRLPGSQPLQYELPSDRVLPGWNIGLMGIKCTETYESGAGGIRKIIVPPHAGLGDRGGPARMAMIPPNATLVFLIEMIAMKDNKKPLPEFVEDPFTPAGREPPPGAKLPPDPKGEKKPPEGEEEPPAQEAPRERPARGSSPHESSIGAGG